MMTLREEILLTSGVLKESAEDALSDLKKFRKDLEQHRFAYGFEEKVVDALENGQKGDVGDLAAYIQEAKQCIRFLDGIVELIKNEQKLISEKINEVWG